MPKKFYPRNNGGGGKKGKSNGSQANKAKASTTPKKLEDCVFNIGTSKQAADYTIVSEYIINHIKIETKNYPEDVTNSLMELRLYDPEKEQGWKPSLNTSSDPDVDKKAREDKQYEIDYKMEREEFNRRKKAYKDNLINAYGIIWKQCAKAMKERIENRSNFKSVIYNNPIELLIAIQEHAVDYTEDTYIHKVHLDALRSLLSCRQKDDESLAEYCNRFAGQRNLLKQHFGSGIVFFNYVQSMAGYDATYYDKTQRMIKEADYNIQLIGNHCLMCIGVVHVSNA